MTHPGGRPRTTSPSPEECIELGKNLVEWAKAPPEEGELKTNFQYWYTELYITFQEWKLLKQKEEFRPYYELARSILHRNMVRGDVKEGIAQRYLRYYDKELMDGEDETAKFNAGLKKEEIQQSDYTKKMSKEIENDNAS